MENGVRSSQEQRENQTRKVMVPVWDDYFQKEEIVPGVQEIFREPKVLPNRRDFGFAYAIHQPQHHTLDIMVEKGRRKINDSNLLKIAKSFNIGQVKITAWRSGAYPNGDISSYTLGYGSKCYLWDDEVLEIQDTIPSDLDYKQVLVYGVTRYENFEIIHTEPI